jgi:hypothetical protein
LEEGKIRERMEGEETNEGRAKGGRERFDEGEGRRSS